MSAKISKRLLAKFVFKLFSYAKLLTFIMFFLVLCNTIFLYVVPMATEKVIDGLLVSGQPLVFGTCIGYVVILLLAVLSQNLERYVAIRHSERVASRFRIDFFHNILRQSYVKFSQGSFGAVETAMTSCIEDINDATYCFFETLIVYPIGLIIGFTYITNISPWLLLCLLVQLIINYLIMYYGSHLQKRAQKESYQKNSSYFSLLSRLYHAYDNIRMLSLLGRVDKKHRDESEKLAQSKIRMAKVNYINISLILDVSDVIVKVIVIFVFYWLIRGKQSTIGAYFAFVAVKEAICGCFNGFAKLKVNKATFDAAIEQIVQVESLEKFLDMSKTVKQAPKACWTPASWKREDRIALSSVEYAYPDSAQKFLFDYEFKKDTCYLIVGTNGVGKTTFVRLMSGMLGDYTCEENRADKQVVFPQNIQLFDESVIDILFRENTVFSEEIAKKLGVLELITRIKTAHTNKAWVNSLSGGEKKKILLTLLLSQPPEVLILDEPFAEVDADSQTALAQIICESIPGRIVIVISHDTPAVLTRESIVLQLKKADNVSQFVS